MPQVLPPVHRSPSAAIDTLARRLAARLDGLTDQPVSRSLADLLWIEVVQGTLATGERLPTTRELAIELGVSPKSVEAAYAELEARGVVAARPGEGTFVSLEPPDESELERHQRLAELCRGTYHQARDLGFTVDEVIDALAEYRAVERGTPE